MICSRRYIIAYVFNNFRNICLEIYGLDTAHSLSTPRLAWKTALKKTNLKSDLLTDINILLTL